MVRWMAGLDGHESTTASGTYFFVGDQLAFDGYRAALVAGEAAGVAPREGIAARA